MIKITSVLPTRYAIWHADAVYFGYRAALRGDFAVVLESDSVVEDPIDEGWIYSRPSPVLGSAYNDCFQYDVSATLTRTVNWCKIESQRTEPGYGQTLYTITVYDENSSKHEVVAPLCEGSPFQTATRVVTWYYHDVPGVRGQMEERYSNITTAVFHRDGAEYPVLRITANLLRIHHPDDGNTKIPDHHETISVEVEMIDSDYGKWWSDYGDIRLTKSKYIPTYYLSFPRGRPAEYLYPWETPRYEALAWYADQVCAFGDLSAEAAKSVRALDINSIAYLKDFAELGKLARSLTSFANLPAKGGKAVAKAAASTYLAAHYGAKLTVKDTLEIAGAIDKLDAEGFDTQRIGAFKHFTFEDGNGWLYSCDLRLTGYIDSLSKEVLSVTDTMKRAKRSLYEADLVPSLANIWDMVPFSFVVDWFVPIGEGAERLETIGHIQTLPVQALFYTRKLTWAEPVDYITSTGDRISGNASCKTYYRQCTDTFAIPPLRAELNPKGVTHHWIESTALLVQFF